MLLEAVVLCVMNVRWFLGELVITDSQTQHAINSTGSTPFILIKIPIFFKHMYKTLCIIWILFVYMNIVDIRMTAYLPTFN